MLRFPSPDGFVQYVRQARRGTRNPFLIVEGLSDKRALLPFVDGSVAVIPADGKDKLLAAYVGLTDKERRHIAFVLDCDGSTPSELKGLHDLVITTNRDVEADLIFELRAFQHYCLELLAHVYDSPLEVDREASTIVSMAAHISGILGAVVTVGGGEGLRLKVADGNRRRRLRLSDLPELRGWLADPHVVGADEVAAAVARRLAWTDRDPSVAR